MSPNTATNLSWAVGSVTITRVEEVVTYIDAEVLMPDFTPSMLDPHRSWLVPHFFSDRNDKMALSIHSFVVESQGKTIVIDTCVGDNNQTLPFDLEFADRLDAAIPGGLGAVDVVLCTHLHFDHVGWNLRADGDDRRPRVCCAARATRSFSKPTADPATRARLSRAPRVRREITCLTWRPLNLLMNVARSKTLARPRQTSWRRYKPSS